MKLFFLKRILSIYISKTIDLRGVHSLRLGTLLTLLLSLGLLLLLVALQTHGHYSLDLLVVVDGERR